MVIFIIRIQDFGKVRCYQGGHELTNLFLRELLTNKKEDFSIIELENNKLIKISKDNFSKLAINAKNYKILHLNKFVNNLVMSLRNKIFIITSIFIIFTACSKRTQNIFHQKN